MRVWEAIQMLQQMDQTKEVTVTFGQVTKINEKFNPPPMLTDYGKIDWSKTVGQAQKIDRAEWYTQH